MVAVQMKDGYSPQALWKAIVEHIEKGGIETWAVRKLQGGSVGLTHVTSSRQYDDCAYLIPDATQSGWLKFSFHRSSAKTNCPDNTEGAYHGRSIEMIYTHFAPFIVQACALP